MSTFHTKPVPHDEAVKAIRGKTIVTKAVFENLLPELRQEAFTVAGIEAFDVLQRIQEAVASVPAGRLWEEAKADIEAELGPYFDSPAAAERRAELLLRLHGFRAYAATNYRLAEAHKGAFPFRQYISTHDSKVRATHAALHGRVLPADSPFWRNHTPPWEWGCRCEAVPLTPEDVEFIQAEDDAAGLPPEERRVMPDFLHRRLTETGELMVRHQGFLDVRTPREKTGDPNAFEWIPGDVGMPLEKILERYDGFTRLTFEAWAKNVKPFNGEKTLWELLEKSEEQRRGRREKRGGDVAAAPATPAPPAAARPPSPEDALAAAGLSMDPLTPWTEAGVKRLVELLRVDDPLTSASRVSGVGGAAGLEQMSTRAIRGVVNEWLAMIPRARAEALPPITIKRIRSDPNHGGDYNRDTRELRVNVNYTRVLRETDPERRAAEVKRLLFHELTHWLHISLPGPDGERYREAVRRHFAERTAGQPFLASWGGGGFREDKWYDLYAGREYAFERGEPGGLEVPTVYLQLLAMPDRLAAEASNADPERAAAFRETLLLCLSILF